MYTARDSFKPFAANIFPNPPVLLLNVKRDINITIMCTQNNTIIVIIGIMSIDFLFKGIKIQ